MESHHRLLAAMRNLLCSALLIFSPFGALAADDFTSIPGDWKWQGYGRILSISNDGFQIRAVAKDSCLTFQSGTLAELSAQFDRLNLTSPTHFTANDRGGFNVYHFEKLAELPKACTANTGDDPREVFRTFSQYFAENYAFLEQKGIDWDGRIERYSDGINRQTSDEELFNTLTEMVADFRDGHVNVLAGPYESIFDPDSEVPFFTAERPSAADRIIRSLYEEQRTTESGIKSWPAFEMEFRASAIAHTNSAVLRGQYHSAADGLLVWGETSPGVGYLGIHAMSGLFVPEADAQLEVEIEQLTRVLDSQIMPYLADKNAVLVDVRFNGGGYDAVSLAIASRFADQERLAFTKQGQDAGGDAPLQKVFVSPQGERQFNGPVYLLTSNITGSAAEIFTLAMMELPHVTRVGETTNGILSDMWIAPLPNGWLVSLSNETYLTPDGVSYEGEGIPPQIEAQVFVEGAVWESIDQVVEHANCLARAGRVLDCGASSAKAEAQATSDAAFEKFIASMPRAYLEISPELATLQGIGKDIAGPLATTALSDYSPQGVQAAREATEQLLAKLEEFDPDRLNARNRQTFAIVRTELSNSITAAQQVAFGRLTPGLYRPYQIDQFIGPHLLLVNLLASAQPVSDEDQAADFLERLQNVPAALEGLTQSIEADARQGAVPPDFVLDKVIAAIDEVIEPSASNNVIAVALREKLASNDVGSADQIQSNAEALIDGQIYPAFRLLRSTLVRLRQTASHDAGIWRLPEGAALYQSLIRQLANTEMSAWEIHSLGLAEVDRILAEMDLILTAQGYHDGTVAERMQTLSEDPRFLYPATEQGKAEVIDLLNRQMIEIEAHVDDWFGLTPSHGVEVRMVPAYQEATASSAAYDPPTLDGTRPGIYWINLRDLNSLPIWSVKSDTYHEVIPGHHLQSSIAMKQGDSALIRKLLTNSAFSEGWALYAELLAKEMGMYDDDPFGDLGRLRWELHRAVRLVVDTGLHAKKWSRERAIAYSAETTGMDADTIEQEVERYAVIPGQALSYKVGMLKILELRARAKAALGSNFDIRKFHDAILANGPMPLNLLEAQVEEWIAENS